MKIVGQAILNKNGEIVRFVSKIRRRFGVNFDDDNYIFRDTAISSMDNDYQGDAPHRLEFIYINDNTEV